jgi:hypothetical protein
VPEKRCSPPLVEGGIVADDFDEFEELPECEPAWMRLDRATAVRKRLLAAGYIPLPVNGKAPPIAGWQDIQATNILIDKWAYEYTEATNTGILTRTAPAIDIDVLDPAVADELQQLAGRMIGISAVRTGNAPKRALLCRADASFSKISTPVFVSPDGCTHQVEVLSRGQQIVVHGIHPDTHAPYTWRDAEPGRDLKLGALPLLSAEKASEFITAAAQCMAAHGWTPKKKPNGDGAGGFLDTQKPTTERERLYAGAALDGCADELAQAPSGERNDTLNKKAYRLGTMVARGWISSAEVFDALFAAAASCGLNADDGEEATRKTLKSGLDDGMKCPHQDLDAVEDLTARIVAAPPWSPPVPDWRAKIVMASDLQAMTFTPVRHIVPGYISEGATIIAGKPKVGKSWMTLDLGLAATADRFTLGTLKPTRGDVLYLALEDNSRRLKGRMAKLWPSSDARWPTRLALATDWKRADEGGLEDIEDWCSSVTDPVMVVVDTLEKFRPLQNGRTNAYSADYAAVTGLQKIAGKHRIAVVVNHHLRKMEADDPFDTVSGTLGLTGAADSIIVLKRHAGAVTLHARGRDIEEVETALQFERATCRWTILGAASEVYVSNERAAVLSALTGAGADGLAVSELIAATGSKSRGAMDTLLFKMKEEGEVVRVKRGVYALPQGKIGQKERTGGQAAENHGLNGNLSNLSDLTGPLAPSNKSQEFLPGQPPTTRPGLIAAEEEATDE